MRGSSCRHVVIFHPSLDRCDSRHLERLSIPPFLPSSCRPQRRDTNCVNKCVSRFLCDVESLYSCPDWMKDYRVTACRWCWGLRPRWTVTSFSNCDDLWLITTQIFLDSAKTPRNFTISIPGLQKISQFWLTGNRRRSRSWTNVPQTPSNGQSYVQNYTLTKKKKINPFCPSLQRFELAESGLE